MFDANKLISTITDSEYYIANHKACTLCSTLEYESILLDPIRSDVPASTIAVKVGPVSPYAIMVEAKIRTDINGPNISQWRLINWLAGLEKTFSLNTPTAHYIKNTADNFQESQMVIHVPPDANGPMITSTKP